MPDELTAAAACRKRIEELEHLYYGCARGTAMQMHYHDELRKEHARLEQILLSDVKINVEDKNGTK